MTAFTTTPGPVAGRRPSARFGTLGRLAALALIAMAATGCSNKLKTENALLLEENAELRSRIDERAMALEDLQRDLDACEQARLAQANLARPEPAMPAGRSPFDGIAGVTTESGGGAITAVVEGDVLFASGQSTVRADSRSTLDRIATVLRRDFSGRRIRVSGHTDSDPIVKSKDRYETNYHLGFERAFAVREYLVSRGVPADRLSIESYGPHVPRGNKSRSRRVEISVVGG